MLFMFKKSLLSQTILSTILSLAITQNSFAAGNTHMQLPGKFDAKTNQFWWPDQLDLSSLRDHDPRSNPYSNFYDEDFEYSEAFEELDLEEVKSDINEVLTTSQEWWPADFGNYGPFFIRLSWHSAG